MAYLNSLVFLPCDAPLRKQLTLTLLMECIENVPHPLVLEGGMSQRTVPGQNANPADHFLCRRAHLSLQGDQPFGRARPCQEEL